MSNQNIPKGTGATTINPVTNEPLKTYPFQDKGSLNASLESAARGFEQWRDTAATERAAMLSCLATVLREGSEEFATLMTLEMGRPIKQSRDEVEKCAVLCDWYSKNGPRLIADEPTTVENSKAYVSYLPLGSILAIMPWNFPFWQALRAAVPIMMAGNGIVLSHSKNVTGCAYAIAEAFKRAHAVPGAFEVINVPTEILASIIADRRIAAVTLTGSVRAGSAVAAEAGQALKKCVLELGGSDPFIVLADADLDAAVEAAVNARFRNAGQICICAKRFILEAPIAEEFTNKFVEATRKLVSGDPMEESTFLGPMARVDLREQIHRQVTESVKSGARLLLGGKIPDGKGAFYPATILSAVKPGMAAFDEETFGPVAAITTARDAEHALQLSNQSEFGLSGNLWTADTERAKAMARRMETGAVYINGFSASDPRVPIGGIKKSGYGRELSHFGIHEFVNAQLVWNKH
jgi:succinate-semialdehyde dehydrogenase